MGRFVRYIGNKTHRTWRRSTIPQRSADLGFTEQGARENSMSKESPLEIAEAVHGKNVCPLRGRESLVTSLLKNKCKEEGKEGGGEERE